MPSPPPDEGKLTEFGRLYYLFCEELGTNGKEVARRAGLKDGAISHTTLLPSSGLGVNHPRRETVQEIAATMKSIAEEKGIPWGDEREKHLLHSAYRATSTDVAEAVAYYEERRRSAPNRAGRRRTRKPGKTPPDLADARGISPNHTSGTSNSART